MWESVGAIFTAIGQALGLIKQRDAEKNAADVKAGKMAQEERDETEKDIRAVAENDLEEMRKRASE